MSSSSSISDQSTSSSDTSESTESSNSLSSLSSDSTKSSASSPSSGSDSSSSSSSSSISSESSPWDTEWFSILHCPPPGVKDYQIYASVEVDLRHSDAVIIDTLGPLIMDFGGVYGESTFASDERSIIDGLKVTYPFFSCEDGEEWQDAMTQMLREKLNEMRIVFETQCPGDFEERHRRV